MKLRNRTVWATFLVGALGLTGCTWSFNTADGTGSTSGNGTVNHDLHSNSAAATAKGISYVFYGDETSHRLRVGTSSDGVNFSYQDLDGDGTGTSGGRDNTAKLGTSYISAIAVNDVIHVFYNDDKYNLRHASLSPGGWVFETLDGPGSPGGNGRDTTLWTTSHPFDVINNNGSVELYYGMTDNMGSKNRLRHGWQWNGNWYFETLDGFGSNPGNGSIQTNAGGDPTATIVGGVVHVVYINQDTNKCRHAWYTGGKWMFEALTMTCNERPEVASYEDQLHLFTAEGDLVHFWGTGLGTPFNQEILDGAGGGSGKINQFVHGFIYAYPLVGDFHIFYFDYDNGVVRHALYKKSANEWRYASLDGPGTETQGKGRWNKKLYPYRQLAVALQGRTLHLWYMGETGWAALRHAAWAPVS